MVHIDTIKEDAITTLVINGDVDASSSIQLDESLNAAINECTGNLLVDGTHLNYISSAGLGVFMSYIEDLNTKNIKMVIFGLNEKVDNVFEILGLDQLLDIVSTKKEALGLINEA
jgi:anti-sigma B factor antagonist